MSDEAELELLRRRRDAAPDFGLFAAPTTHPEPKSGKSQNAEILRYLREGRGITSLEALQQFGCSRLAARIADLRDAGHFIASELITLPNGKRVARYTLEEIK